MNGFYYHFNNQRLKKSQHMHDFSAAHAVLMMFQGQFWNARRLLKWLLDRSRSSGWLTGQPGCLAAWLPGCLAAWLPGCLAAWLPRCFHRWSRSPRSQPQNLIEFSQSYILVLLIEFSQSYIFLTWLSLALVEVGGSDFIGYAWLPGCTVFVCSAASGSILYYTRQYYNMILYNMLYYTRQYYNIT